MSSSGPVFSLFPGTIVLQSGKEVTIVIHATVSCNSPSNTLEITLKRDTEMLHMRKRDGSVGFVGSNITPPFPVPHILLNNIVSFDPLNIHPLLNSTLRDDILCNHLSVKVASLAERFPVPLYISLRVKVTPHRLLLGGTMFENAPEPDEKEEEEETCSICLLELYSSGENYVYLPDCGHEFHDNCIDTWLSNHDTCPLCRTPFRDIEDD